MRIGGRHGRQRLRELSLWLRELGVMLRNGTDLVAALSVLEAQDFSKPLRTMTTEMIEQASGEAGIEDLVSCRAEVFPPVVVFALRSGQAAQRIPETLLGLADALERAADLGMTLLAPAAPADAPVGTDQAPVIRIVNSVLRQAAKVKASEVHLHASDDGRQTQVECRVRGEWQEMAELPLDLLGPMCRRICVMAGINWALKQPALGTLRIGQRDEDTRGTVQFVPGEHELEYQVRVTLGEPNGA